MQLIGYTQVCYPCQEEFENKQEVKNCPLCNLEFKHTYKHFVDPEMSTRPCNINLCYCDSCLIRFDTDDDKKSKLCKYCGQDFDFVGFEHIDYIRENKEFGFWDKLKILFLR